MHPDRVGPYLIEKKIGAGGMGTVYLARHAETGEEAAVKLLPASLAHEEGFVARFEREIDALRKISSSYIVKLLESGAHEDTFYYAMEYVDGETLTLYLRRERRLDWKRAIEIAIQICTALKAAHDAGIIHRDLKPSNLMIAKDGTVKLTDFGVAQVFAGTKLTVTGGVIGTAEYMSPEQATGRRATKQSDLYSLGAVMYAMLTGKPPFTGKTTVELIQKHRYGQFDRPRLIVPEIPHWLEDIVCQLLEKEPEKRFPDAFVLSRRLQEVLKKVELSESEKTIGDATGPPHAGISTTVPAESLPQGPGSGTLMRDLVRAEIERAQQPSPLEHFFNSTWTLVIMLVLLIAGGISWFRGGDMPPQKQFEAGVAILEQPEGSDWLTARDEYFLPLLEADAERWQPQVDPYLQKIELYELKTSFGIHHSRRNPSQPQNDAERFLRLARHYHDTGDTARAENMLTALNILLAGSEEHQELYKLSESLLKELQNRSEENPQEQGLLESSMRRADLLTAEGKHDQARDVWASVIALYKFDPAASTQVARARKLLKKETSKSP